VAWKLCTTMKAEDVAATLDLALQASGLEQTKPVNRPKLLSDNSSSYIAGDLANGSPTARSNTCAAPPIIR
jgi:transposase InsO family protein